MTPPALFPVARSERKANIPSTSWSWIEEIILRGKKNAVTIIIVSEIQIVLISFLVHWHKRGRDHEAFYERRVRHLVFWHIGIGTERIGLITKRHNFKVFNNNIFVHREQNSFRVPCLGGRSQVWTDSVLDRGESKSQTGGDCGESERRTVGDRGLPSIVSGPWLGGSSATCPACAPCAASPRQQCRQEVRGYKHYRQTLI
jgi:hypothetical protein